MPLLEQVLGQFPKEVKLVYKSFPLRSIHPQAQPAAEAAMAAHQQGRFWEYHDRLFQNQARLSDAVYRQIAKDLGLDMDRFEKALASPQNAAAVERDVEEGNDARVRGTPSIYINGRFVQPAQRSPEGLRQLISEELARK